MAIIKQYHKDTDTTYVYESTSYWDAEKGQSRSKRRVIGKIDPETGEVVPTGKRGRRKAAPPAEQAVPGHTSVHASDEESRKKILQLENTVVSLNSRIRELENIVKQYQSALEKTAVLSERITAACRSMQEN